MIKLYYCNINNFGDWINPLLIECITNKKIIFAKKRKAEIIGIGSILNQITRKRLFDIPRNFFAPELNVWTTGFIKEPTETETFRARKMNFLALRGHISKQRVEKIIGKTLNIPLGDGGLLFNLLLDKKPQKKFSLGIIPHTSDFGNPIFQRIKDKISNSTIIDFKQPPLEVLNQIASCETIISTAMHGLIAADSLGIPNQWIEVSNNVIGKGYKFQDYYSVFGINNPSSLRISSLEKVNAVKINNIIDTYKIKLCDVEKIRKELYNSLKKVF